MLKEKLDALYLDIRQLGGLPIRVKQILSEIKLHITAAQYTDIFLFADKMNQLMNYALALEEKGKYIGVLEDQVRDLSGKLDKYELLDATMGCFIDGVGLGMTDDMTDDTSPVMTDVHKGTLGAEPDGAAQYVPTPTREFVGIAHKFSHTDFVKLSERVANLEKTVDYLREGY